GLKKTDDLLLALQPRNPGDKIKLAYQHESTKDTVEITLAAQPGTDAKAQKRGSPGVQIEETEDGVILTDVVEQGAAHKGGLQVGDVLVTLGGAKIGTVPLLFKTLQDKKIGDTVELAYVRGGVTKEITLTL